MCMPRSALASLPLMFHEMVVGADSDSCSKVTVPLTVESPRTTATVFVQKVMSAAACTAAKGTMMAERRDRRVSIPSNPSPTSP